VTPDTGAFLAEARDWLAAHAPPGPLPSVDTAEGFEWHREWERALVAARLSVVSWPEEYGGRDASLLEWLAFEEAYYAAGGPVRVGQNGLFLLAPTLFAHGTQEQRDRLLPPMARADEIWAQAWSEPEAGGLRRSRVRVVPHRRERRRRRRRRPASGPHVPAVRPARSRGDGPPDVLAAQAVLASGDEAACERLLPAITDGSAIVALAWTTPACHWDIAELGYNARAVGRHWELHGEAHYVLDGAAADVLLVAATTPDGPGLFEVDVRQHGVARTPVTTMDASRELAAVRLADVIGRRIGGDAAAPLAFARDQACIALGAEQVGAAQRALELTVAHLLTRVQFGQPIGAFQALQHRAADLHVLVESARSLSRAMAADTACDPDMDMRAAAVKVYCSETLAQTASEMIQLHGAIGVTWEHQAHRYLKRAHSGRHLFGSPARHLSAIAVTLIDAPTGAGEPTS
jgi:alkylation response protein AidB-like acyl-CoA dehydrogenase